MTIAVRADDGVTLVELLVAMAVSSLLALLAFGAFGSTTRTEEITDEESRALASLRVATQRFVRELRQSGKVYNGSTARRIEFWVDYDRGGDQDDGERITWEVREVDGRGVLVRSTRTAPTGIVIAEDLIVSDIFVYNLPPPRTTLVALALSADADLDSGGSARRIETEVRLRGAPG